METQQIIELQSKSELPWLNYKPEWIFFVIFLRSSISFWQGEMQMEMGKII